MSGYVIGSLIGGGCVLAGGFSTALREARVRQAEHRAARGAQLEAAMRDYLAALDALALELADAPAAPSRTRIDSIIDWLAARTGLDFIAYIVARLLRRAIYRGRVEELTDRMILAATHLRLVAPDGVLRIMRNVDDARDRAGPTGWRWDVEWEGIRGQVREAFRAELASLGY